jgi:hypothetical protein
MSGSPIACWNMHGPNQVRLVSSTGQWLSRPRDPYPMEVITPWPHAKPYSVGSGHRTWFSVRSHCLLPVRGRTTPPNQVRLDSTGTSNGSHCSLATHANLIQLVQGTEQVVPTAMIRYMVVILARQLPPHEPCQAFVRLRRLLSRIVGPGQ